MSIARKISASFVLITTAAAAPFIAFGQNERTPNRHTDTLHSQGQWSPRFSLNFQATYVYQYKPEFAAKYSGPHSLSNIEETQNSLTSTIYLGIRLWKGAEIYINPEVAGGSGLSGAYGLAASTNGETFRVGDPSPTLYLGRGYFTQTFRLGHCGDTSIEVAQNEMGGMKPKDYLKFYIGKISLGDLFDNNAYANSPRTQFMNWCLMNNGAYDYAANTRGYTYAFASVLQHGKMCYKAALATLPTIANGAILNTNLGQEYSVNAEISRALLIKNRPGNVRLLGYYNNGHMGNYEQALHFGTYLPDITATRQYGRTKTGIGLSGDQQISNTVGVFLRAGWNDGKNETWAFTESDREISAGVSANGTRWKRSNDNLGLAFNVNGITRDHRYYLEQGGNGFQLGDYHLTYANETALELYYSCNLFSRGIWLTADYQLLVNPGYNSDRGPANVCSVRLHAEVPHRGIAHQNSL